MATRLPFDLTQYFRPRIPQLYYGASQTRSHETDRQRFAGALFIALQVISWLLVFIGAVSGYLIYQFYGLILGTILGYTAGIWLRRSLGIRGRKATTGFFARIRERALGARPGLLEWLVERIGQDELTQDRCRAITQAHEKAVQRLKQTASRQEQNKILADLDRRVRHIITGS
ncbi:MAG: hypothetical protein ACM3PY_03485 [Omnitrophica WOR_2 bacterium]